MTAAVGDGDGDAVALGADVLVCEGIIVVVSDGEDVGDTLLAKLVVPEEVTVGVQLPVLLDVIVTVGVEERVPDAESDCVAVLVTVAVGDGDGDAVALGADVLVCEGIIVVVSDGAEVGDTLLVKLAAPEEVIVAVQLPV